MRARLVAGTLALTLVAGVWPLRAQDPTQRLPSPQTPQSESTGPQDPRSTGAATAPNETLSERLDRSDGVIRPRTDIAPDMSVRPPVPDPGTTPVIPPPGVPGGNQTIAPK